MQDLIDDLEQGHNIGWTDGIHYWKINKFKLIKKVKDYIMKHYEDMFADASTEIDPEGVFCGEFNYDRKVGEYLFHELRHRVEQWFMKQYPAGKEVDELEVNMEMIGFRR